MPNLYITNNNTKTTVGLTEYRKTTPSLVATCGNTTYYGSLTTCADWATKPNKIVVTSGSTTYYTTGPSRGIQYVNFVVPYECPTVEGTVMAQCCKGYMGYATQNDAATKYCCEKIANRGTYDYGSTGAVSPKWNNLNVCGKALLYTTNDTTVSCKYMQGPSFGHVHDIGVIFDDNVCFYTPDIYTRHKGIRVCCNYFSAPKYIYGLMMPACYVEHNIGGSNWSRVNLCSPIETNVPYDYFYVNGGDDNRASSVVCMNYKACGSSCESTLNTSWETNYGHEAFSSFTSACCSGCSRVALVCGDYGVSPNVGHVHNLDPKSGKVVACMCKGLPGYVVGFDMSEYNYDIDLLPSCTMLWTNCPIDCFNQTCWSYMVGPMFFEDGVQLNTLFPDNAPEPIMQANRRRTDANACFCINVATQDVIKRWDTSGWCNPSASPSVYCASTVYDYPAAWMNYSGGSFLYLNLHPWSCTTAPTNWRYSPFMSVWHSHEVSSACPAVSISFGRSNMLPTVRPGKYLIMHK